MDSSQMTITYKAIQDRAKDDAQEHMPDLPKIPENKLYADSARGIYIPQHFAESVNRSFVSGVDFADLDLLAQGPNSCESYWDIWNDVEQNCILTDSSGQQWQLHQDGDLWLFPLNAFLAWEAFQRDVEDVDAFDVAHESCEWDWVIYCHRALELCHAVPTDVLHDAESEWHDMGSPNSIDWRFGLYEFAFHLAAIIVTREIAEAVESLKDELVELAEEQMMQF